jgi:chromosome segregation ATPase
VKLKLGANYKRKRFTYWPVMMPKVQRSPLKTKTPKTHSAAEPNAEKMETYHKEETSTSASPCFVQQRQKRPREHGIEEDLEGFKTEMKNMITTLLNAQQDELKKISSAQKEIKVTNGNIENSLAFLTTQNDELKKKLEQLQVQSKKDRDFIVALEDKIEDLQREQRKANIEIKNVPKLSKETKEDLTNMMLNLSKAINFEVRKEDIKEIYRVHGKKEAKNNTPIVVELSSTMLKIETIKHGKIFNSKNKEKLRAKHLGATKNEETAIFISEQMTAKGARLHFLARDLARSKGYRFCWTSYGRVYVRKEENSPIILVRCESQIQHLMSA